MPWTRDNNLEVLRLLNRLNESQVGGKIWHTKNEHDIIRSLNGKKQGQGIDAIDPMGRPYEIRESRKTPKFRLQRDVHQHLVKKNGYYVFKQGKDIVRMDAKDVTPLLKTGPWSRDRTYPYKFLKCEDVGFRKEVRGGGGLRDQVVDQNTTDYYSDYFLDI